MEPPSSAFQSSAKASLANFRGENPLTDNGFVNQLFNCLTICFMTGWRSAKIEWLSMYIVHAVRLCDTCTAQHSKHFSAQPPACDHMFTDKTAAFICSLLTIPLRPSAWTRRQLQFLFCCWLHPLWKAHIVGKFSKITHNSCESERILNFICFNISACFSIAIKC